MSQFWYEIALHLMIAGFAIGVGLNFVLIRRKGTHMPDNEESRLDRRRTQGGYTFNDMLEEMRRELRDLENGAIEDVVNSEEPKQREIAAELIRFCRRNLERVERMLNMRAPQ